MAVLARRVTTGPWISMIDSLFGGTPEHFMQGYQQALWRLQPSDGSEPSLTELAAARLASASGGQEAAAHFGVDWLHDWWPEAQPVEPIMRAGLVAAIKAGMAARLPLVGLWVQATERSFEIAISQSASQITVLFLTPPAPSTGDEVPTEQGGATIVTRRDGRVVVEPDRA